MSTENPAEITAPPTERPSLRQLLKLREFWIFLAVTAVIAGATVAVIFMNWSSWTTFCLCQFPSDAAPIERIPAWTP